MWEGWKAGFLAFHPFHILSFPWSALECAFKERTENPFHGKSIMPGGTLRAVSILPCLLIVQPLSSNFVLYSDHNATSG
jgi:hypothetical protein